MSGVKILNKSMEFDATFSFSDAEVDAISKAIFNKITVIGTDHVHDVIQGMLEGLVMEGVQSKPTDEDWLKQRTKGMSKSAKASYIRGWQQVGKSLEKPNE